MSYIPDITTGEGGLPKILIHAADGASAELYLHGAHLTSWRTPAGGELLYMSRVAEFTDTSAIRGGVPLCWPQFGGHGPLPKHGFVRNVEWSLLEGKPGEVCLQLVDNETTRALWPQRFRATFTVRISASSLVMELRVENTGTEPFSFTAALHPYLRVDDLMKAHVTGLGSLPLHSTAKLPEATRADTSRITFGAEVDAAWLGGGAREVILHDGARALRHTQRGFADTVVWNPGPVVAANIPDLDQPDGWQRYVCVEPAALQPAVTLPAGVCWTGGQTLDVISPGA